MKEDEMWVRATACENIPVREGRMIEVCGRQIAIFNLGDKFLAVDNRCPHQGGPLAEGIISGATVVCPLHAWKIDLQSGMAANAAACVATFQTRVCDGIVDGCLGRRDGAAVVGGVGAEKAARDIDLAIDQR